MRLHRGPLTFLPKGVLTTPRQKQAVAAAPAPAPVATTRTVPGPRNAVIPRSVQADVAYSAVAKSGMLFAKGAVNAVGRMLPDLPSPTPALEQRTLREQLSAFKQGGKDAVNDMLADATFKVGTKTAGLVAQGALQALDRNAAQPVMDALYQHLRANRSALEPIRKGVEFVGSLMQTGMPPVLGLPQSLATGYQPDASIRGDLKAGLQTVGKEISRAMNDRQQALQAKMADAAFRAVADPAARFARGAMNAAARQISALDLAASRPVRDPEHRPLMPGGFPGTEQNVAAMLSESMQTPQNTREKWTAQKALKEAAKRDAAADETFRHGVEVASLVGHGAFRALDREALQPATDALHRQVRSHRAVLEPVKVGTEYAGAVVQAAAQFGKDLLRAAVPAAEHARAPASPRNEARLESTRMPGSWVE